MTNTENRDTPERMQPDVVVDDVELEAARNDPRVWAFLAEADAYLAELERQGRNL